MLTCLTKTVNMVNIIIVLNCEHANVSVIIEWLTWLCTLHILYAAFKPHSSESGQSTETAGCQCNLQNKCVAKHTFWADGIVK